MGPELHYQLIINRVAELHEEAAGHRRAREARRLTALPHVFTSCQTPLLFFERS